MTQDKPSLTRREFLQRLAIGTAGALLAAKAGSSVWAARDSAENDPADDGPADDPRNIDNAKEVRNSAISKEITDDPPKLSDGTIVDQKLAPVWQAGIKIALRQIEEGKFFAWTLDTNPVWMWVGEEADDLPHNAIRWSQPEIAAFGESPTRKINFDGLTAAAGSLSLLTTIKDIPYTLAIPAPTLEGLQHQRDRGALAKSEIALETAEPAQTELALPALAAGFTGLTIECWLKPTDSAVLLSTPDFALSYNNETRQFELQWGNETVASPPLLTIPGDWHHLSVSVDAAPRTISWVLDGEMNPQLGWKSLSTALHTPKSSQSLRLAAASLENIALLRIYERPLRTAECVSNYQYYGQGMGVYDYVNIG